MVGALAGRMGGARGDTHSASNGLVAETAVGKTVPVVIWRKRQQSTLQVKVGKLEEADQQQASAQETPKPKTAKEDGKTVAVGQHILKWVPREQ